MTIIFSAIPAKESFVVTPPESLVAGEAATFEFKFHSNPEVKDLQVLISPTFYLQLLRV
jgi:hypothetical protein